jgi:flavin reductase ActVB
MTAGAPEAASGLRAARVDSDGFRAAMSRWASGVAVVTSCDPAGRQHGFTATSFTAVSLDPPMVLVCLDRSASCSAAFATSDWYAVHVLHSGQEHVARQFASKGTDKFAGLTVMRGSGGLPVLDGALALLECRIVDRIEAGDHVVLLGEVHRASRAEGRPLVYHDRSFGTFED